MFEYFYYFVDVPLCVCVFGDVCVGVIFEY